MKTKTQIVIELPDHVADAVVELSKTIDLGTLLRDALGEFASRRTPAAKYVAERYPGVSMTTTARARKIDEVERRIAFAEAIHSGVARVEMETFQELRQCQGSYKPGWYIQGHAGWECEHGGEGHDVAVGEKLYVDGKGHIFCEAHADPKTEEEARRRRL